MTAEGLDEFFFGEFGACDCGDPDAVAELLFHVLRRISEGPWRNGLDDLLTSDGVMFSYLGWLNHIGLLEHGSSLPGWLTDRGREVLAALVAFGTDAEAWTEIPIGH